MRNTAWIATIVVLAAGACSPTDDNGVAELREQLARNDQDPRGEAESHYRDSAGDSLIDAAVDRARHPVRDWELDTLRRRGLSEPIKELLADLQNHPELIPWQPEAKHVAQFGFYYPERISVLSDRWVLAYTEDGHVGGNILLEFTVNGKGRIQWEVIKAYLDHE